MRKVIIGTAGHVDHGKTTLIEGLTGIDCDRWNEEKERGITLDLGFAHLSDDEVQLSFVDVPGHERFLHNALAGMGGLGAVLLVVDAGEGVRPQTREHLEIVRLLDVRRVVVALTKVDNVDDEWLELVAVEVGEFLRQQGLGEVPVHRVSAVTGSGLEDLARDLKRTAGVGGAPGPTRLPIDRAFQITGHGTVVTGSPAGGTISADDELAIDGGDRSVRVRRVEVHGRERETAGVGERVAAQLAGAGPEDLPRGTQLVARGAFQRSRCFAARLTLLPGAPPLESARDLRVHLFSADFAARVRPLEGSIGPGESGWVEGVLERRTVLAVGDRAILRRPSPPRTLGGLEIIDPAWRRPSGNRLQRALELLAAGQDGLVRWWADAARLRGVSADEVARRRGLPVDEAGDTLQRLGADGLLLPLPSGGRWVAPTVFRQLTEEATADLNRYHREHPLEPGMPKAEFVRRHLAGSGDAQPYLDLLASTGVLNEDGGSVARPDQGEQLDEGERRLADRLEATLEELGFAVPSPDELARDLGAKPQIVEGLLHYLQRRDKAVKLPTGLWLSATTIERTIDNLRSTGWQDFSVGDFKERYGISRKWAIPVLEYLDAQKVTARKGDRRLVLSKTE